MLLIGSKAAQHWFEDFPRQPKDWDYVIDDSERRMRLLTTYEDQRYEYHTNHILLSHYSTHSVLPSDALYTLKISHLFWDIKWDKHMFDVQFLKKKGCALIPTLFTELHEYWIRVHGKQRRSDLSLDSKDFFNNALKTYDHDYLHTLLNPIPTYTKVLKDGAQVEPDENKFYDLSHQEKLDLVREEVMVMAFERLAGRDPRVAYSWMLKKFIRSHAPMWEALWIIDNFIELHKPVINYKQILENGLSRTSRNTEKVF